MPIYTTCQPQIPYTEVEGKDKSRCIYHRKDYRKWNILSGKTSKLPSLITHQILTGQTPWRTKYHGPYNPCISSLLYTQSLQHSRQDSPLQYLPKYVKEINSSFKIAYQLISSLSDYFLKDVAGQSGHSSTVTSSLKNPIRNFSGSSWLILWASNAGGIGSILAQGTKIPYAALCCQKSIKKIKNPIQSFPGWELKSRH